MNLDNENKDLAQKINDYLLANRKTVITILSSAVFIIGASIIWFAYSESSQKKAISAVENVIYEFEQFKKDEEAKKEKALKEDGQKEDEVSKKDEKNENKSSTDKQEAEEGKEEENTDNKATTEKEESPIIRAEEDKVLEKLASLSLKHSYSYAGFRAHTAMAEIYFHRKDYENAFKHYESAALSIQNAYTEGLSYFNAASCADELGNYEKALAYYQKASQVTAFPLIPRALFNVGRLYENLMQKENALAAYNKLLEKYPQNEWALLAKNRVIVLSDNLQ